MSRFSDPTDAQGPLGPTLARYVVGQATPAECARVDAWRADSETHATLLRELERTWAITAERVGGWDTNAAWESAQRRASNTLTVQPAAQTNGRSLRYHSLPPSRWRAARYAVAGIGAFALLFAISRLGVWPTRHEPRQISYTTGNGQRANITLSDGSTVTLNVASRLDVPADFAFGNRTLTVHGAALFNVVHARGTPFTVVTDQVTARVLGTSFLVRRYATDSVTTVAVREGRVAVRAAVVSAGQQVNVGSRPQTTIPVTAADAAQFAFATGVLTLNGVPLKDAIAELDRWYDADIRIADPAIATHLLQGTFTAGALTDLAAMLEYTFDVRVVRDGRVLTLYHK